MGARDVVKNGEAFRLFCKYHFREVLLMKKSTIWGVVISSLALVAVIVALCVYMKELRRLWESFWDKMQAKRANLQIYMD